MRTEPKTPSRDKFVEYTESWRRPAAMEPTAAFTVGWQSEDDPPKSSFPAQIAWKSMRITDPDAVERYHRRLLEAYFTENRDISDWGVLADLARSVGVDDGEFLTLAQEQQASLAEVVIDEHNDAVSRGITGIPTVLIDDQLPVPGAQDVDVYEQWITKLIANRTNEPTTDIEGDSDEQTEIVP